VRDSNIRTFFHDIEMRILYRLVEWSVVLLVSAPCLRSGHSMQPQTDWRRCKPNGGVPPALSAPCADGFRVRAVMAKKQHDLQGFWMQDRTLFAPLD
jgi:hypothetical protein